MPYLTDLERKNEAAKPKKYVYTCIDKEKRIESGLTLDPFDKGTRMEYYIVLQDRQKNVFIEKVSQRGYYTYVIGKTYSFSSPIINRDPTFRFK